MDDDLIPPERREAVRAALLAAFGRRGPVGLEPIAGGMSGSGVWRLQVGERRFLLKLEVPPDGLNDPHRQHACMRAAAEAGIAPRLVHADPAAGVFISDFIAARPLAEHPGGRRGLLAELGAMVRRLQATPRFPPLVDFFDGVEGLLARLEPLGLAGRAALVEPQARLAEIREAWTDPAARVSSHNDLNPRNVVSDGKRLWFVDWQAAFCNDPWVDVATAANFLAPTRTDAEVLLRAYLGAAPGREQRARFSTMRQVCRLY
jgi:hypothetical protein